MPGNVFDGVPQQFGVVDAERGDAADLGLPDDVGGVVLAADAHLHDGHVDLLHAEDVDGEDGEELEVLRAVVSELVVDAPEVGREQLLSQSRCCMITILSHFFCFPPKIEQISGLNQ